MIEELENMKSLFNDFISAADEFIEKEKQKEKPVAGWYTYTPEPAYLMFRTESFIYGFGTNGFWYDKEDSSFAIKIDEDYVLADRKEVEQRLIEEAKRLTGTTYVWYKLTNDNKLLASNSNHPAEKDVIILFDNGIWAEIIPEPLTLNGKEVAIIDNGKALGIESMGKFTIVDLKNYVQMYLFLNQSSGTDVEQLLTKIEENENK